MKHSLPAVLCSTTDVAAVYEAMRVVRASDEVEDSREMNGVLLARISRAFLDSRRLVDGRPTKVTRPSEVIDEEVPSFQGD